MHPTVERFAALLREMGAAGEVRETDGSARTAADAAAALGCEVGAIASSLVFLAGEEPVLVMTSGAHRVDPVLTGALLGVGALGRADADTVREATGYAIGGVAPIGHPAPLRTLVDVALAGYDVVWAAAGHPRAVFPTTYAELLRLTGGTAAEVSGPVG